MLTAMLVSGVGAASIVVGGAMAFYGETKGENGLQAIAGALLIVGFACLGIALSLYCRP